MRSSFRLCSSCGTTRNQMNVNAAAMTRKKMKRQLLAERAEVAHVSWKR